ncbi:MAG: PKD domain-containing protein [Saprospiraceae bacterium]|nr:PKD domain-containing protein [Saprospiraceae bacterium]
MLNIRIGLACIWCLSTGILLAQSKTPAALRSTEVGIFGMPTTFKKGWEVILAHKTSSDHVYAVPTEEIIKIKQQLNQERETRHTASTQLRSEERPGIGVNFSGNVQGNNVPPDNSMAVSRNGFIVSAINSNIIFANTLGKTTFTQNLVDFFTLLTIGSSVYDPRVIYDPEQNKFIVLALHGNTPQTTKLVLAFSKKEDPAAGWYYYNIDGNPLNDPHWFDYPNVGLTKHDLFISGLMRNNNLEWQYSIVYQIDKLKCFEGQAANWTFFDTPLNADGTKAFNLVATHSAWNTLPEDKMFFISNTAQGGNQYHLHRVTGSLDSGSAPILTSQQTTGPQTALAPDGAQPLTTNVMNTFDSRIWNAMELNGTIHFGAHVNSPDNTSALFYGRANTEPFTVTGSLYHQEADDYAFPSIAAFGAGPEDTKVLINFLKSGPSLFPSQGAVVCDGAGANFDWGKEVMSKEGINFVNVLDENRERWGDYTTVSRRFWNPYSPSAEVWSVGCFGKGSYGTWITQYMEDSTAVFQDFAADKTAIPPGSAVNFTFLNQLSNATIQWEFEGGNPALSANASPNVSYAALGNYGVKLKFFLENGDSLMYEKADYITVMNPVLAPVANFSVDQDTIFQGQTVHFVDLSTNDPVDYSWTFQNGNPATSIEVDPMVTYTKKGSHYVNLTVRNIAGNDNETKQKFITVLELQAPRADFAADKVNPAPNEVVSFTDMSQNLPSSWKWYFPGGTPSTSDLQYPSVLYEVQGIYDVALVVQNLSGKDSLYKTAYIQVGSTATVETTNLSEVKLFPNPVFGEFIVCSYELKEAMELEFSIVSATGSPITRLIGQRVKQGRNELSFNTSTLTAGLYHLVAKSPHTGTLQAIPFVIGR